MLKPITVFDCNLLQLPKIENRAGNITPIHNNIEIPFDVKRVFYFLSIYREVYMNTLAVPRGTA
jgi:hypothetical protein